MNILAGAALLSAFLSGAQEPMSALGALARAAEFSPGGGSSEALAGSAGAWPDGGRAWVGAAPPASGRDRRGAPGTSRSASERPRSARGPIPRRPQPEPERSESSLDRIRWVAYLSLILPFEAYELRNAAPLQFLGMALASPAVMPLAGAAFGAVSLGARWFDTGGLAGAAAGGLLGLLGGLLIGAVLGVGGLIVGLAGAVRGAVAGRGG